MRPTTQLLFLLTLSVAGSAQHVEKRKYLDARLHFTDKRNSAYSAIAYPEAGRWVLKAVYRSDSTLLTMSFTDETLTIKDGPYTLYHPNGVLWQKGHFKNDRAEGIWQSWYDNGQTMDSGRAGKSQFCGLWKHWYDNGQLKNIHEYTTQPGDPPLIPFVIAGTNTGNDLTTDPSAGFVHLTGVSDGRFQSWYENGQPESEGALHHDTLTGVWKWFRDNGRPAAVETYAGGKVTGLECYDENGALTGNSCSILKPAVFTHPYKSARQYIADQLKNLYDLRRSDVGPLRLRFIVTSKGKIDRLTISNDPSFDLQLNIIHIFSTMPAWSPAISHNRLIDYPVTVQVF